VLLPEAVQVLTLLLGGDGQVGLLGEGCGVGETPPNLPPVMWKCKEGGAAAVLRNGGRCGGRAQKW
jgi:hypothetical protein